MARKEAVITCAAAIIMTWISLSAADKIWIEPHVNRLLVARGHKQVLTCSVTTDQPISPTSISWTLPSQNAKTTTRTRTEDQSTYRNILTIESFTENEVGVYTCKYSSLETKIQLVTVIESKIEGEFIYGNKSDTAVLQCTLEFPSISDVKAHFMEWLRHETVLDPKTFQDFKNGTLVIPSPTRNYADKYVARYKVDGGDLDQIYNCEVEYTAAPLVLDMAKSKNIVEGHTLSLECVVKGYPHGNITWLKNGEEIVVDPKRIRTESYKDYEDAKLIIENMKEEDEGNYTCKVTDELGRMSSKSINVRVKDKLDWLWPIIGILCEAAVLAIIILICNKVKKDDQGEKPADEREGLLRQGSGRNREHN